MKKWPSVALCCLILVCLTSMFIEINLAHSMTTPQQTTVSVNIGLNFGTGPIEWHNDTAVPSGESLLNATKTVATVETVDYPGLGAFVTSINGISQNPAANLYWMFWVYSPQAQQYELGQVGASAYLLTSDQTVQWYYSGGTLGPNTSISFSAHLDTSTDPPTAVMSGSIHPIPSGPVNVTLEYSQNQGANYQEIVRVTSGADGTFSYSWRLPGGGIFMIRADAQGIKSSPVSLGTSGGVPGFPLESLLAGGVLGLVFAILLRKQRLRSREEDKG